MSKRRTRHDAVAAEVEFEVDVEEVGAGVDGVVGVWQVLSKHKAKNTAHASRPFEAIDHT